ncbi:phage major capsid protein [Myxococcus sp. AM001]|nr:phage major capsid protein [Myxococcus sp. AM001]
MSKSAPAPTPKSGAAPALPPHLQRAVDTAVVRGVESALASRPNAPQAPTTSHAKDLLLDVPKEKRLAAALGYRLKSAYLARAERHGKAEGMGELKKFMERVKAAGLFAGVFEQGGLWARETWSSELVEVLRPRSILLAAGARTIGGYGAKLNMGTLGQGVTVYWTAEGKPVQKSNPTDGAISLGAHKLMALCPISNDLLRLGNMDATAVAGEDMAAAISLEVDQVGIKGKGPKKPNGLRQQMKGANRTPIAGTTLENKIADVDGLVETVDTAEVPGGLEGNSGFYYMSPKTYFHLRAQRDTAGWVWPELRDLRNPRLNGMPVFRSTTLNEDRVIGFGLAQQLILGEAVPLEVEVGEDGADFSSDMVTMRGITQVDWLLRHAEAFAEKTGVTY